jgi:hypothetical protein
MSRGSTILTPNGTVHRAAANGVNFRTRAARGSVCNGLLFGFWGLMLGEVSRQQSRQVVSIAVKLVVK